MFQPYGRFLPDITFQNTLVRISDPITPTHRAINCDAGARRVFRAGPFVLDADVGVIYRLLALEETRVQV